MVYTDGRTEEAKMRLTASPENYLRGVKEGDYLKHLPEAVKAVPMVVLINGGSALRLGNRGRSAAGPQARCA